MFDSWYYTQDGKTKVGPLTFVTLQQHAASGALQPTHMVRQEGEGRWIQAKAVLGLFPAAPVQSSSPPPLSPPPLAIPVHPHQKTAVDTIRAKANELWVQVTAQPKNIRYAILGGGAAGFVLMTCLCCGVFGMIGGGSGSGGTKPGTANEAPGKPASNKPVDFTVTADGLLREFVANTVLAEQKYKGKTLKVGGKVGSLSDAHGIPGGPHFQFSIRTPHDVSVVCVFDTENQMKPFWKKKEATVIGKCDGALPGSIRGSFMVILRQCEEGTASGDVGGSDSKPPKDADEFVFRIVGLGCNPPNAKFRNDQEKKIEWLGLAGNVSFDEWRTKIGRPFYDQQSPFDGNNGEFVRHWKYRLADGAVIQLVVLVNGNRVVVYKVWQ